MQFVGSEGFTYVHAHQYTSLIRDNQEFALLMVAPTKKHLKFVEHLHGIKGSQPVFVMPIDETQSHLVDIARAPRIRFFKDGKIIHDVLLNQDDLNSLGDRLRPLGLF